MVDLQETKDLLRNRPKPLTFEKIKEKTGISIPWLTKFNNGHMSNPAYYTIEKLNNFLKGKDDKQSSERN